MKQTSKVKEWTFCDTHLDKIELDGITSTIFSQSFHVVIVSAYPLIIVIIICCICFIFYVSCASFDHLRLRLCAVLAHKADQSDRLKEEEEE